MASPTPALLIFQTTVPRKVFTLFGSSGASISKAARCATATSGLAEAPERVATLPPCSAARSDEAPPVAEPGAPTRSAILPLSPCAVCSLGLALTTLERVSRSL